LFQGDALLQNCNKIINIAFLVKQTFGRQSNEFLQLMEKELLSLSGHFPTNQP
jgi:hypothetical protein